MPKARGNIVSYGKLSQSAWDKAFPPQSQTKTDAELAEFKPKSAPSGDRNRTRARWPIISAALATNHPEKDAAMAKKHGVNVEFNEDGCPILTSENHRREYLKAIKKETGIGWFDKSAYY